MISVFNQTKNPLVAIFSSPHNSSALNCMDIIKRNFSQVNLGIEKRLALKCSIFQWLDQLGKTLASKYAEHC